VDQGQRDAGPVMALDLDAVADEHGRIEICATRVACGGAVCREFLASTQPHAPCNAENVQKKRPTKIEARAGGCALLTLLERRSLSSRVRMSKSYTRSGVIGEAYDSRNLVALKFWRGETRRN